MHADDRRAAPRHRPLPLRVHLVWGDGERLKFGVAQLRDVSQRGAAISLESSTPLPETGSIVLGLEGLPFASWVHADIMCVLRSEEGQLRLGLEFAEGCPNLFFRHALAGGPAPATERASNPTEPDSCWTRRTKRSQDSILGRDRPRDSRWLKEEPMLPALTAGPLVAALH